MKVGEDIGNIIGSIIKGTYRKDSWISGRSGVQAGAQATNTAALTAAVTLPPSSPRNRTRYRCTDYGNGSRCPGYHSQYACRSGAHPSQLIWATLTDVTVATAFILGFASGGRVPGWAYQGRRAGDRNILARQCRYGHSRLRRTAGQILASVAGAGGLNFPILICTTSSAFGGSGQGKPQSIRKVLLVALPTKTREQSATSVSTSTTPATPARTRA